MSKDVTQPSPGRYHDKYQVLADYDDHQAAAMLLSDANNDLINFLRYLKNKYLVYRRKADGAIIKMSDVMDGDDLTQYELVQPANLVQIVRRICTKYNPEVLIENRPSNGKDTSYTIDKGRKMYVCLRDAKTHKLHDKSLLLFVMLHELSHIGNSSWGHRVTDFWPTFKFILHEATIFGIVSSVDYSKQPVDYCGMRVSYSPLYDPTLPSWWK